MSQKSEREESSTLPYPGQLSRRVHQSGSTWMACEAAIRRREAMRVTSTFTSSYSTEHSVELQFQPPSIPILQYVTGGILAASILGLLLIVFNRKKQQRLHNP